MAVEKSLQEPCTSEQDDARLAVGQAGSEKHGGDSLKTLQEFKHCEKREAIENVEMVKKSRQNPLLPAGSVKEGYVVTE